MHACVGWTPVIFFSDRPQSLLLWPPLKQYVQLFSPVLPHYRRGLKTSINVGAVDCRFSFYEMKCDRIM